MSPLELVRLLLLVGGFLGAAVFVAYYHFTARWFRRPLSRYLMSGPLGLLSLYAAAMANSFIPIEWVRETIRMFMVLSAFLFAWYSVLTYHRMRKELKRSEKGEEGEG